METFTVGLIGCGGRSWGHVEGIRAHKGFKLVAVADLSDERRRLAAERTGARGYGDPAEMFARERPDVACICTKEDPRYDLTLMAANAGVKAIVLEKPMARTIGQAREMVRLCEERNIILVVSHQMRFCEEFVAQRDAIAAGKIGRPYFMRATSYGHLMEQGPHMVDMLLFLMGNVTLEWVMGSVGDLVAGLDTVHPAPAFVVGYMCFANGVRAVAECGRQVARPIGLENETWLTKRVQVLGTEGTVDAIVGHYCRLLNTEKAEWQTLALGNAGWNNATIRFYAELYESLTKGVVHRNNGGESLRGFEAIHAIYHSALTQERVPIPLPQDSRALEEFMERAKRMK